MRIVRHARPGQRETAIAIGSFDGVHRGHAAILKRVVEEAGSRGLDGAALTFEPLPREFFAPALAPSRLTSLAERLAAMARSGLDIAFVQRFDRRFAALSAEEFARRLREQYRARWVMVGEDFRYGAKRAGDLAQLREAGRRLGFEVAVQPMVMADGSRISSTGVREALARGDFAQAASLLGRPYAICGRVVHGAKRGRGLGFPTANLRLARPKAPLQGIFAVKCFGAATRGLEGVASLGINPAVNDGGPATLEAFLFDFSGDLYGRRLTIEFVKKLRDEAHFASLDELAAQIRRDCDAAREHFRGSASR
ncbi:MAG: bifunctional riboflavin kinase/FAD synthetase [Usitatibacter sp.]